MRRALLIVGLALLVAASAAQTAGATFPGRNGPIAFRQFDPTSGGSLPLFRARPDGTHVTLLTDRPGFFSDWRADGRRIAFDFFEDDGSEQIATMTARGGDLRVITSGPGIHEVPSWSPDGRRIVFDYSADDPSAPDFETRLWTMRDDGSRARPLPMTEPGFDTEPRYSPDGRWIAFARLRSPSPGEYEAAVFIVGAQGGGVSQLTPWGAYVEHPTWSPDSRWIVFNTPDGTVEVIRPDGRKRHTILARTESFEGHKPWFSPDGSRILFMCATTSPGGDYNEDICVMRADGSHIVNLTNSPSTFENWPSWGPAQDEHDGDD
jgi:TolB protein